MTQPQQHESRAEQLFIGIDWADQEHAICIIAPNGQVHTQSLKQQPEAILDWVAELERRYPRAERLVAVEQSRGALVHALLEFDAVVVYPINPKQLARYREAVYPSGGKGDPTDAELLAQFLKHHPRTLRPWRPDSELTRRIRHLAQFRRKLVDERKRVISRLRSTLKLYFPFVIEHFGKRLGSSLVTALLKRWPSLKALQRAHPKTLRKFFNDQGVRNEERQTQWIHAIRSAVPLTRDAALIDPHASYVVVLCDQIQHFQKAIADFDTQLEQSVNEHPDAEIFRSLPGAGEVLVPRLIAAVGSERDRYDSAEQIQCQSGIAPVTRKSGKSQYVSRRYACPKFQRQTFHEFANHARLWCDWSKAYYRMKRKQGMKHHAILRALAYKWIRIIFRLWKTREPYSRSRYLNQLKARRSPIINFLENQETCPNQA